MEDELENVESEKYTYAGYRLKIVRGSRGYHSSNLFEADYASVFGYPNKRNKKRKSE